MTLLDILDVFSLLLPCPIMCICNRNVIHHIFYFFYKLFFIMPVLIK